MKRHIPNVLTLSRLVMAVAMFAVLASYDAAGDGGTARLDAALAIFIVAGVTDVLDGTLARKTGTGSAFGRIADPFVDKLLICGCFAYFAGANFAVRDGAGAAVSTTGVAMWMAVLIFAREILVTGIRGFSEARGTAFTTTVFGKAKMALQSVTIMWILLLLAHGHDWGPWARTVRDVLIWVTVVFTAASALVYVGRTRRLMAAGLEPPEGERGGP